MRINADFTHATLHKFDESGWKPSPSNGVHRILLDRIGDEVARATSLVRYAPKSHFPGHVHGGGEEFFVLRGVFSDEHGDYPAGTYVRNPIGSRHVPFSTDGCIIWVKLWQFQPGDTAHVVIDTSSTAPAPSRHDLHAYGTEKVYLQRLPAGAGHTLAAKEGGAEALVLDGSIRVAGKALARWSWYRGPKGENVNLMAGGDGARLLIKEGHLAAPSFAGSTPVA
jgi:hypothetical protein